MELKKIEAKEFDEYVLSSPKAHFMQSSAWGEVNEKRNYIVHRLALVDKDEIKGTALLLEKKILNFASFYCPRGPVVDYSDRELTETFLNEIKSYCRKHSGLYLKIDPDLIIRKLDKDGNPIETFENSFSMIDFFKENGGTYKGFTTNFIDTANPRFTFRVNVDRSDEELLESFHSTTRNIIRRNNPYRLHFEKGGNELIGDFYKIMKETSLRKKMYLEPLAFFENFHNILGRHDMSDVYVVYGLKSELQEVYRLKKEELERSFEEVRLKPDGKKKENLLKDLYDVEKKLAKETQIIDELKEEKIILSSMITAKHKDKVWTVHGGNADELKFVNANYELYYNIIRDARAMGYRTVDFFGTEGKVDKNSDIYGIYLFKLRFGGDFDEFIGEFDFVLRPLMNSIISRLLIIRRKYLLKKSLKKK